MWEEGGRGCCAVPRSTTSDRRRFSLPARSFVFDYDTLSRQKLNDRMTYPLLLDLNGYVTGAGEPAAAESGHAGGSGRHRATQRGAQAGVGFV